MNAMTDSAITTALALGRPVGVHVENVVKRFGRTPALRGVSLDVAAGELLALLGPSGSGKTTLLRILAGLEGPDAGRVLFGDRDALGLDLRQRNVGFVFQNYALFRHMTVFDNVAFGLAVRPGSRRPSRTDIRTRVMTLLDLVQLSGLDSRYPGQLSGGQQQRVALARALAIEPSLLLLDEPFGALDAKVRRELRRWLRDLHDRTGHTTVFVTHDQEEAMELADRVVVMSSGAIDQTGTPDEIYDAPNSPSVFAFIGESSALPVRLENGRVFLDDQPLDILEPALPNGAAQLYLRPQDLDVVDGGGYGAIAGTIAATRRHGGGRRIELEIGKRRDRLEFEVPSDFPGALTGYIAVKPRRWRLFRTTKI